jgi:preprotein translocase subunit SecD
MTMELEYEMMRRDEMNEKRRVNEHGLVEPLIINVLDDAIREEVPAAEDKAIEKSQQRSLFSKPHRCKLQSRTKRAQRRT